MIYDIHSHTFEYPLHFGDSFREQARFARTGKEMDLTVRWEEYSAGATTDKFRTVVFGGKAKLSGLWVDDEYVADYVAMHPRQLVGFMSLDPTQDGWYREMRHAHEELGMQGIKLLPMYAGFYPNDKRIDPIWRYAQRNNLPVLLHTGTTFIAQAPLDTTRPVHLDDVATRFPGVKIIMAHLSHPYEGECVVTIRKHPNVYADISALFYRPFQLYNSLSLVQEYGVWHKVLFGTDYPFTTIDGTVEGVRNLNNMLEGTSLPRLNADEIEKMIFRNNFKLLGLK